MTNMKLRTKQEKHVNDNEKRRQALRERAQVKLNQTQIIKQALSSASLHSSSKKKIILDNDDDGYEKNEQNKTIKSSASKTNMTLFDASSSENEDVQIKEKPQFAGKKGFELFKLQSSYGDDERFKINERFLDSEEPENFVKKNSKQVEDLDNLLESKSENSRKVKKRTYEMIRYDASNKDHEKYEMKPSKVNSENTKIKQKVNKKKIKSVSNDKPSVEVSKEKFFEVSKDIKSSFTTKKEESSDFSLLHAYGHTEIYNKEFDDEEEQKSSSEAKKGSEEDKQSKMIKNVEDNKAQITIAQGIWKESFFFITKDSRFEEGLNFINKKNSQEAVAAAENYGSSRKILREIIRLRNKKLIQKKNPFKNKIGGLNKKKLNSDSKVKNNTSLFKKKKPFKVNSLGKF